MGVSAARPTRPSKYPRAMEPAPASRVPDREPHQLVPLDVQRLLGEVAHLLGLRLGLRLGDGLRKGAGRHVCELQSTRDRLAAVRQAQSRAGAGARRERQNAEGRTRGAALRTFLTAGLAAGFGGMVVCSVHATHRALKLGQQRSTFGGVRQCNAPANGLARAQAARAGSGTLCPG